MQIDRLVIIAGPTCAGKSTLIEKLLKGGYPSFSEKLRLGNSSSWKHFDASHLHNVQEPNIDQIILHYDILYRLRKYKKYENDKVIDIFKKSKNIIIGTLWANNEILIQRLLLRKKKLIQLILLDLKTANIFGALKKIYWVRHLFRPSPDQIYMNPNRLSSLYSNWLKFCKRYAVEAHWIINTMEDIPAIDTLSGWLYKETVGSTADIISR